MTSARAVLALLLASLLAGLVAAGAFGAERPLALMREPTHADSLLVLAPHPDDESLCCAGFILRAVAVGARVTVVWVTSGDAFELDAVLVERTLRPRGANLRRLAAARIREGQCAASLLGVAAERQVFLGYPDGGLRELLGAHYAVPYRSPYTGADAVPYAEALEPGALYEGRSLEAELDRVIDAAQPTLVLAPTTEDRHPDHAAVGELARRALGRRGATDRLYSWIVHAPGRWPRPRGFHPDAELPRPYSLRTLAWLRFPLTAVERERKRAALGCHDSQMRVMSSTMLAYDRANEIFAH
jgi:LmbE family N-acetylglucosaminyl deacetylase